MRVLIEGHARVASGVQLAQSCRNRNRPAIRVAESNPREFDFWADSECPAESGSRSSMSLFISIPPI